MSVSVKDQANGMLQALNHPIQCDGTDLNNCLLIDWLKAKKEEYGKNGRSCGSFFVDEQGNLGSFSKLTAELIFNDIKSNEDKSLFLQSNSDFRRVCPKYDNFTVSQKAAFHGWILELTAFPESQCTITAKGAGVTTKAVCMFQLEDKPSLRYWRSNGFSPKRCAVSEKEIMTLDGCTGCAFDEYRRKMTKDGTPFGVFNESGKKVSGAYWASHNRLGDAETNCMLANLTKDSSGKPAYLKKCKGANWEWMARYKFFERIQRFPLCGTKLAAEEIKKLKATK
mgnify:FL=1